MTQITTENKSLPAAIEATLRGLIRRARAAIIVRGVLLTLAAAVLGVLASMGIAAGWLPSEPWQHYALTFLWLAVAATAAFVWLLRPLAKSFSLSGIARVIEQRHPELQERISSTVELLGSDDSPEIRGSQVLIDALASEAVGDARAVRPKREITFRKIRPPLYVLTGAVAVIVVLLAIYPRGVGRLLTKTIAPYLNLPNIYADDLKITPGDCVIAENMPLEITASSARKVRSARLRIERTSGTKNTFKMTTLPDGSFVYASGPLSADGPWGGEFRYRIHAGDAYSQYYSVKVVPRPEAKSIRVGYEYPEYMQQKDAPMRAGSGRITGPAGATAVVRINLNKPASEVKLTINDAAVEITQADALTYTFSHKLAKDSAGRWRLALRDEHNFKSDPIGGEIIVKPDTPPNVRILHPTGQKKLKLHPTDRVEVTSRISDDFGVKQAQMLISIDGKEQKPINLDVADETSATLNLASLDLSGAKRVTFRVKAWDNMPDSLGGPQAGVSETRTIELDIKARAYTFQVQLALDLQMRDALKQIYEQLKSARKISEPLRRSMPGTKILTRQTTDKIDRMREYLLTAEETSRNLTELTAGTYPKISEKLTKLTDDHIGRARELAGLVKITDAQKQRAELTDEADFQIDRSLAIVSEMLEKLHVLTDLAERAVVLEELAKRQKELAAAKMPTATTMPDAKGLSELTDQQWQKAQQQVAAETAAMLRQTPRAMHEALKEKGKQTTDLAEIAKRLQQTQQALTKSADDEQSIAEMKKQLAKLAAEQAKIAAQAQQLARQSAKVTPTKTPSSDASKSAAEAAKALKTTKPESALEHQAKAVKSLEQTARQAAAEQLADAADALAKKQQDLAKHSETAKKYQADADTARKAAAEEQIKQKQIMDDVTKRSANLAARQSALAKQSQPLEKATNPSKQSRPSGDMKSAADSLRKGNLDQAQRQAAKAAGQASKLSDELSKRAESAAKAAEQADAKANASQNDASAKSAQQQAQAKSEAANRQLETAKQLAREQTSLAEDVAAAAKQESANLASARQAGQKAAAQQSAAQKATGKIQNLAAAQTKLTKQVGQLKELAKQATRQAAAAMSKNDPTGKMQAAASRLRSNRPDQATKPQTDAAEQLRKIAQAARSGAKPAAPSATTSRIASSARKLAAEQEQLRKRTADLTGKLARTQAQRQSQELTRLRAEQQKIAKASAKLSDDVKSQSPQPDRLDTHAARSAADASKQLAGNRLAEAAKSANKAAGELGELAGRLAKAQADAPQADAQSEAEGREKLTGRAGQLAQRQQQVSRQIADLAAGKMSKVLAGRQGQIAEQTKKTAEDVELLKEHIAELMPDAAAGKLTESAAKSLQQASSAQGRSRQAMSSGRPGQSIPSQQASAKSLGQAAAALAQLGRNFAAQAKKLPAAPTGKDADKSPGQLAQAYDAAQSAGQNPSAGEAAKAARLLATLAKQASQQARAMGMMPGAMGARGMAIPMSIGTTGDNARAGMAKTDLREGELIELGLSDDDWARLPGQLKDQILQASRTDGSEEYRILIKRYFRALARQTTEKNSSRKEDKK